MNKQDVIILGVGGREGKGRKMKQFEVASLFEGVEISKELPRGTKIMNEKVKITIDRLHDIQNLIPLAIISSQSVRRTK